MDHILQKFTQILCGTLDNQEQIDAEQAAGKQVHPYAKHVTAICDHKIINRPADHEGIYILEESYYVYPGKEMDIKPLLFYMRSDGKSKALLQSVQIPEHLDKAAVVNTNEDLVLDFNELSIRPFGVAEYTLFELPDGDVFLVNHIAHMGNGVTFQLTETLSKEGLSVMETVKKNGQLLTPYDTPIFYKPISR